jgi:hypothetical protein
VWEKHGKTSVRVAEELCKIKTVQRSHTGVRIAVVIQHDRRTETVDMTLFSQLQEIHYMTTKHITKSEGIESSGSA